MLRLLPILLCLAGAASAERVVLVSFDGLGNEILKNDPVAEELTVFHELSRQGVQFDGIQPHFPSTTSNSHAAIWTGTYGNRSNISFNSMPYADRNEHRFTDREVGFLATELIAEPIWVTAARQGKRAVAHQPTQGFPFTPVNTAAGAVVVNGYQTEEITKYLLLDARSTERHGRTLTWRSGPYFFNAEIQKSGLLIRAMPSRASVFVRVAKTETVPPKSRELARYFSKQLLLPGDRSAAVHFRLFSLEDGSFQLLQTPVQELALHDGSSRNDAIVRELIETEGAFVPNGAGALRDAGQLTEEQYLETVEFQIRQATRHAVWLNRRFRPEFLQSYLPFPDESDHRLLGRDRFGDARARELRRWAYVAINRGAYVFASLAKRQDTLAFVSDHGMTPIAKAINIRAVLKGEGLQDMVSQMDQALLVNTTDWRGGTVSREEKRVILSRVRAALGAVRDPETGEAVVTSFYTPDIDGERFGIGGSHGGDLYFDLLPRYIALYSETLPVLSAVKSEGKHGFLPARDDMLAICIARGSRFKPGTQLPRMRSINIAPMISEVLGISAPKDATGISPLTAEERRSEPKEQVAAGVGSDNK